MVKRQTKRPLPGGEAPPQAVVRGASGQVRFPEPEEGKAFEYPLIRQLRLTVLLPPSPRRGKADGEAEDQKASPQGEGGSPTQSLNG